MSTVKLVEYQDASSDVRAVYDDIMRTRKTDRVNTCSHTASARRAGMTEAMLGELMAVVGMANETNALANADQVPVDDAFLAGGR